MPFESDLIYRNFSNRFFGGKRYTGDANRINFNLEAAHHCLLRPSMLVSVDYRQRRGNRQWFGNAGKHVVALGTAIDSHCNECHRC